MSLQDTALALAGRLALRGLSLAGAPRLSILVLHRVLLQEDPLFPAELDAPRFDRLMRLVAANFRVLPLRQAVQQLQQGTLPQRALCITFDDGYADNHAVALPILQRLGLPATFFIATGFLDGGRMFNDTVIEAVRRSRLPQADLADLGLGRLPLGSPAQRAAAIGQVLSKVKYMTLQERPPALARLLRTLQVDRLPDDLMMSSAQVLALHRAGMHIGAHTVHHPILQAIDDQLAEQEIATGRDVLQRLLQAPVPLFAYPNGRPGQDYGWRHVQMVRRLGFEAAVTTAPGASSGGADLFQLPRFTPWDREPGRWLTRLVATRRHTRFDLAPDGSPA